MHVDNVILNMVGTAYNVALDNNHPETEQMRLALNSLSRKLREDGKTTRWVQGDIRESSFMAGEVNYEGSSLGLTRPE